MMDATVKAMQNDIEALLRDVNAAGEWGAGNADHDAILERWRARQPDGGMTGWRFWVKLPDDEFYQDDYAEEEAALAAGRRMAAEEGEPAFQIIQARCWVDDIEGDEEVPFARSQNARSVEVEPSDSRLI